LAACFFLARAERQAGDQGADRQQVDRCGAHGE
jgi:hypothetical protein